MTSSSNSRSGGSAAARGSGVGGLIGSVAGVGTNCGSGDRTGSAWNEGLVTRSAGAFTLRAGRGRGAETTAVDVAAAGWVVAGAIATGSFVRAIGASEL